MKNTAIIFIILALFALLLGATFGLLAGTQYIHPNFLKNFLAFNRMRPFHVTTVVGWIILCVTGGIYYYLINDLKLKLYSFKLLNTHLILFIISAIAVYVSFSTGVMGGREYLTYFPLISIPILLGWILFALNYFKTALKQVQNWPVYLWMWATGIGFMIYHFSEAHLWLLPYFRENFVRDLNVQWKSYGSFVGSWNMLVYGTAIYLMSKIKNDESTARGKKVFFFYFLGLTNLMLGWAHHTYIVPTQPWVRNLAYIISMTEWVVLINIIWEWQRSLTATNKIENNLSFKFLLATDFWVFVNLFVALLISIPYINLFTHGTHITVAHSMGTTVGINTTILLASVLYIISKNYNELLKQYAKYINVGYWIFNISLLFFLTCLLIMGVKKSFWMYGNETTSSFGEMQANLLSLMQLFVLAGIGLLIGLFLIVVPLLKILIKKGSKI